MTRQMKRRVSCLVRRPRTRSLADVWADRLGIETTAPADRAARADHLEHELHARFEHLCRFVLGVEMPPVGKSSAEAAVAHGDLWVLTGFLADARQLMSGEQDEEAGR